LKIEGKDLQVHDELIAIDFSILPWTPQRVFTVVASEDSQNRGNHLAGCNEFVTLICGNVSFYVTEEGKSEAVIMLKNPGESIFITSASFVRYTLHEKNSTILVLADRPYEARD
jgi:hypothetical protein